MRHEAADEPAAERGPHGGRLSRAVWNGNDFRYRAHLLRADADHPLRKVSLHCFAVG
jgi:hypothetical protein